jgi:hypothetical protein
MGSTGRHRGGPARRLAVCAISGLLVVAGSVTGSHAAAPTFALAKNPSKSASLRQSIVPKLSTQDALIVALRQLGETTYSSIYEGISYPPDGNGAILYLTDTSPSIQQAFDLLDAGLPLQFVQVPNSRLALDSIQNQVLNDFSQLTSSGIDVNEFGPELSKGLLGIGVVNLTDDQKVRLEQMYGASLVDVYNVPQSDEQQPNEEQASRTNDYSPWNASDVIWGYDAFEEPAGCSLGYGMSIDATGATRVMTSGHCYLVGSPVYNASRDSTDTSNKIGEVIDSSYNDSDPLDVEVIPANPGLIWRGDIGDPVSTGIVGTLTNTVNEKVCADGSYGGEICGFSIDRVDFCKSLDDHLTCHLVSASGASGHTIDGDSGGPWFHLSNGNVYASGIHRGYITSTGEEYFTGIGGILSHYGASFDSA